ncbi:hypothetical protein ACH5RR_009436 [Cinchona calisaya]|uniref:MADF domain-containing protein n=1 Tax=Cinchona calisaya TaxID=153742 RepID=A0ABD3AEF0_9GENT
MAAPPAPIPSDIEILKAIHTYFLRNRSYPYFDGELGTTEFVRNFLHSNVDPQLVRQRMNTLQEEYLARRHMLDRGRERPELWPLFDQQRYVLSHLVWSGSHYSDSDTTPDETNVVDQTNQATSSRAAGIHHSDDSDNHTSTPTPTPTGFASAAENTPEKSYSADQSNSTNNVSSDENTPAKSSSAAHQTNTNTIVSPNPVSSLSRNFNDPATSSMTKRRRLFENLPTTTAAQDINILTKMVEYSESETNYKVYPYVGFVRNWVHSDAEPGEIGKRIQELRKRLLLDLSKKLWHHEFGNPNDESGTSKSSDDKS